VTRRRSSYRTIASLQRDNRVCRACAEAGYPIESLPIVLPYTGQRAYMFGQAPGIQEGQERLPWRGRAGKTLRRWFDLDEDTFYATFYCASVTRCYPGRAPTGRGDRTPTPREQELCDFWREWEFELLRPELVIPIGGLAARRLLGVKSITECVGVRYERDGYVAIPLPHPSGASSWLNVEANRARVPDAVGSIKEELDTLGIRSSRS
jgi:uracil-DNA glycosylase